MASRIARIISEMFNGFLTMILTPVIAVMVSPLDPVKEILLLALFIFIPLGIYLILKKLGKVTDYEFTNRKEREPFFVALTLLFGLSYFVISRYQIYPLSTVLLCLFLVTTILTLVTFVWKMSGHMTYSTLLFCTLIFLFPNLVFVLLFIFTPLIAWSRIELGKHTLLQVIFGTFVTLSISILIYWVF